MKTLTLTQPWATLVAIGAKCIETRGWSTPYRGALAIHAAKGLADMSEAELERLCLSEPFKSALIKGAAVEGSGERLVVLPRGKVVAICNLVACVPTWKLTEGWLYEDLFTEQERAFGNYEPGRYAWILSDVHALLEPIPARGALGLWEWQSPAGV
jgi:hypothetical protein